MLYAPNNFLEETEGGGKVLKGKRELMFIFTNMEISFLHINRVLKNSCHENIKFTVN